MSLLDASKAKAIVHEYLPRIRKMHHMDDWKIDVLWLTLPDGTCSRISMSPGYQIATIKIDIGQFEEEAELKDTLWHEMIHIFHGDFETYRKAAIQHIEGENSSAEFAMDEIWSVAVEHIVRRIETLFSLGLHLNLDEALAVAERQDGTKLVIQHGDN